jgi:hypothetical protein
VGVAVRQLIKRLTSWLANGVRLSLVVASCVLLIGAFAVLLLSQHRTAASTVAGETQLSSVGQNPTFASSSATTTVTVLPATPTAAATATMHASPATATPTRAPLPTPSPTPIPMTQEVFTCASATRESSPNFQYYYLIHICLYTSPPQPNLHVTNMVSSCGVSVSSVGAQLDTSGAADWTFYDHLSCTPPTTYTLTAQTNGLDTAPCGDCTGQRLPLSGSVSFNIPAN